MTTDSQTGSPLTPEEEKIREDVRKAYAAKARQLQGKKEESSGDACCGPTCCTPESSAAEDAITKDLYKDSELAGIPQGAAEASLGCGNPTALAELHEGETVLDLGSGGGIDVLLSARRVGATGKAYGLDMTDEMLELARENQRKAGVTNVEFLKGEMEDIPLPDNSVDVVISNCVINLSPDKRRVLAEALRVLKPGGRVAVSDVVAREPVPDAVRRDVELWGECIAGTLEESEYRSILSDVGFTHIDIEPTRIYSKDDLCGDTSKRGLDNDVIDKVAGKFMSAFVRATKPTACC